VAKHADALNPVTLETAKMVSKYGLSLVGKHYAHFVRLCHPQGVPILARHGFEIVDKRSGKEVYLDGSWAELFQQHIQAWQVNTPTQEEVEDTLDQYAVLAQNPVVVH